MPVKLTDRFVKILLLRHNICRGGQNSDIDDLRRTGTMSLLKCRACRRESRRIRCANLGSEALIQNDSVAGLSRRRKVLEVCPKRSGWSTSHKGQKRTRRRQFVMSDSPPKPEMSLHRSAMPRGLTWIRSAAAVAPAAWRSWSPSAELRPW